MSIKDPLYVHKSPKTMLQEINRTDLELVTRLAHHDLGEATS